MGLVTLANSFATGSAADGTQVRANDDAIVAVVNGNLDKTNLAVAPDFPASVLTTTSGKRLVATQFEVGAVDASALKADATVGAAAAAVHTANHVTDGILNGKKGAALTWGADMLEVLSYTALASTLFGVGTIAGILSNPALFISIANVPDAAAGTLTWTQLIPLSCYIYPTTTVDPNVVNYNSLMVMVMPYKSDGKIYFTLHNFLPSIQDLTKYAVVFNYLQIASR